MPVEKVAVFRQAFAEPAPAGSASPAPLPRPVSSQVPSAEVSESGRVVSTSVPGRDVLTFPTKPRGGMGRQISHWAIKIGLAVGTFLLLLVAVIFLLKTSPTSPNSKDEKTSSSVDFSSLAKIIEDYVDGVNRARNDPNLTKAQKEALLKEVEHKFQERLNNCGPIVVTGKVREVEHIEKNIWKIRVDGPEELRRLKDRERWNLCLIDLFVALDGQQSLQIHKADLVKVEGSVAYKNVEGNQRYWEDANLRFWGIPESYIGLEISRAFHPFGFPSPEVFAWVLVFGADTRCTIGPVSNIPVIGEVNTPRIKRQRENCEALFAKGQYQEAEKATRQFLELVPKDSQATKLLQQIQEIQRLIAEAEKAEKANDYATALKCRLEASEINPTDPRLKEKAAHARAELVKQLFSQAEALIKQEKYKEAAAVFRELLKLKSFLNLRAELEKWLLSQAEALIKQEKYEQLAAVFREMAMPDVGPDLRGELVKRLLPKAKPLIEQRKYKELLEIFQLVQELERSASWVQKFLDILAKVSEMDKLYSQIPKAPEGEEFWKAWELAKQLRQLTRGLKSQFNKIGTWEIETRLPDMLPLLTKQIKEIEQDIDMRFPDLTGVWEEKRDDFMSRAVIEIDDKGKTVSLQLKAPCGYLEELTGEVSRTEKDPRSLTGKVTASFQGWSSKYTTAATLTIPEKEIHKIQVRFAAWPKDPKKGPAGLKQPLQVEFHRKPDSRGFFGPGLPPGLE
jgi:tetratricopeptide (TPR) repeat protein